MRRPIVIALATVYGALATPIAQAQQPAAGQGPQCTRSRLVGTWERVSLLRNALSVQPPDAPLFVKFSSDGHWSMMEMPDDRPKTDKLLEKHTEKELFARFDKVEGGYGTWLIKSDILTRKHVVNIAPGGEGNNQDRLCSFEGEILALIGTGANRSPQARFKRLPAQPMKPHNLAGTWERTSLTYNGKPQQPPRAPLMLILGEDGWFSETELPTGRKPLKKPLEQYTVDDYVQSFRNVRAARGTYTVEGNMLTRKHVADTDPLSVGYVDPREFTLDGDTLTLRGKTKSGEKVEATFKRSKPLETSAQ
jgi:Lipocalin-like domain